MLSLFEIYGMKQLIFIPWTIMFLLSTYTRILVLKIEKGDVKIMRNKVDKFLEIISVALVSN